MNSKQRRKMDRKFPYEFKIHWTKIPTDRYIEAREWCRSTCGKDNFTENYDYTYTNHVFKFSKKKDAVMFALKWAC